jgi:hypothetical protein
MTELQLLRIEEGDSQNNIVDKINYNFSGIIEFGGGPYGKIGKNGPDGFKGETGPIGSYGDPGQRGNIWNVGPTQPSGSNVYANDYWMNTDEFNNIYVFDGNSWSLYGINVRSKDLFYVNEPITNSSGTTSLKGYFISSQTPVNYTTVISDVQLSSGTSSVSPNIVPNPQYSKFVISVDGSNPNKNILEFSKSDYATSSSFTQKSPKFYWNQGLTAARGNYGLGLSTGYGLGFVTSSDIYMASTESGSSIGFRSERFTVNTSSNLSFNVSASSRITLDFSTGTSLFSTSNISYAGGLFSLKTPIYSVTVPGTVIPTMSLISSSANTGNLRYIYPLAGSANINLLRGVQASGYIVNYIDGSGLFYFNKRINSIQNAQSVTATTTSVVSGTTIDWVTALPSISLTSTGNYVWSNNGMDLVVAKPSSTANQRGLCLWTPATGGSMGGNGGWLKLLENGESINFRVHSNSPDVSSTDNFRFIGLNTSNNQGDAPNNTASSNYSFVDLSASNGVGASTVDITIVNITGAGSTAGTRRWYKVYYSAWGGGLTTNKCGVLTTYNATA